MNMSKGLIERIKKKKYFRKKKKSNGVNMCSVSNSPQVEDLIVSAVEHKILKEHRKWLETNFQVKIHMLADNPLESDLIFVSVEGDPAHRDSVKKFLAEKMKAITVRETVKDITPVDNSAVQIITLSESESEPEEDCIVDFDSTKTVKGSQNLTPDNSVCAAEILSNSSNLQNIGDKKKPKRKAKNKNTKVRFQGVSSSGASDLCEVTSTTDDDVVTKKAKLSESVLIIEEVKPEPSCNSAIEFIPLISENKSVSQKNEQANKISCSKLKNSCEINKDDSVMVIDEPQSTVVPRRLRPILIDGSNVAIEHGRSSHTFSVKGIKLAVDYFVNRGHTQVTAVVPRYRRSETPKRSHPTTDAQLFDELEKEQRIVFVPSRRVNGKCVNPYDDRIIVQLATSIGGVIVSNDNYADLINESESFKETIQQRLLMFMFLGDVFVIPEDPYGRNGPKLNDILSFPPEENQDKKE